MANNLSAYGLSALNVVWNDTTGHVAVEGRNKLRVVQNGPAGVLFKQISTLQEAVTLGGLYLYKISDPAKWHFVCGTTLTEALALGRLGKIALGENDAQNNPQWDLFRRRRWHGHMKGYKPYGNSLVLSKIYDYPGGDLYMRCGLKNFFDSTDTLGVLGIVTGATEGRGYSALGATLTHSYMATQVPMNVPFSRYMTDIRASQLEAVPAKVRDYYDRTFDEALAAYVDRDSKPTVAITTIWEGNTEIAPVRWKPLKQTATRPYGSALNLGGMPDKYHIRSGIRDPRALRYPQDAVYDDIDVPNATGGLGVGAWASWEYTAEDPARGRDTIKGSSARLMTRAGHAWSRNGSYQGIIHVGDPHPKDVLGMQNGEVSGLKVGYLRDFHVLGRSLVAGQRYATAQANHEHLADLVIETLDDQLGAAAREAEDDTRDVAGAEDELTETLANEDPAVAPMYQRGTLSIHLARFSNLWDTRAKALAKKEN